MARGQYDGGGKELKESILAHNDNSTTKTLADTIKSMQLTKNLKRVYRDKLRDEGALRLGSFAAYRTIEGVGKDEMEGNRLLTFVNDQMITIPAGQVNSILPSNINIGGGYLKLSPGANNVNIGSFIPDTYMFCASEIRLPEFGDSSFLIIDDALFLKHLMDRLRSIDSGVFGAEARKVDYAEKIVTIKKTEDLKGASGHNSRPADVNEYFSKPVSYKAEREFRFVFFTRTPLANEHTDIVCDHSIIAKCCSFPD